MITQGSEVRKGVTLVKAAFTLRATVRTLVPISSGCMAGEQHVETTGAPLRRELKYVWLVLEAAVAKPVAELAVAVTICV